MSDSYEESLMKLEEMRSRYKSGFSHSDRQYIEQLHMRLFGEGVKNLTCGDCYRDAYIENYTYLKKMGKVPEKKNFILKAGALLRVPFTSMTFVNPINDEDAIAALAAEPKLIVKFAEFPKNWEKQVADYKAQEASKQEEVKANANAVQELEELRKAYDELQKADAEKADHIKTLEDTIARLTASDGDKSDKKPTEKKNAE